MNLFMPAKIQFKFQIEEDLRERLNNAAKRLGRDTAQEVVEEILTIYFPVWIAVADSTRRAVEYQTQKTLELAERNAKRNERQVHAIDRVEPLPDDRVAYVRGLGELTDERKQKPIRKKAGKK